MQTHLLRKLIQPLSSLYAAFSLDVDVDDILRLHCNVSNFYNPVLDPFIFFFFFLKGARYH
uniref:Uncharacterized protein n=1 Tax=Nelumbo nucifera TaxID=4432 RepID=A0A822Z5V8_NELNU|nr:TPA_asm: hypothetical protein HUJ06_013091 [Nelumbo nucifera]